VFGLQSQACCPAHSFRACSRQGRPPVTLAQLVWRRYSSAVGSESNIASSCRTPVRRCTPTASAMSACRTPKQHGKQGTRSQPARASEASNATAAAEAPTPVPRCQLGKQQHCCGRPATAVRAQEPLPPFPANIYCSSPSRNAQCCLCEAPCHRKLQSMCAGATQRAAYCPGWHRNLAGTSCVLLGC